MVTEPPTVLSVGLAAQCCRSGNQRIDVFKSLLLSHNCGSYLLPLSAVNENSGVLRISNFENCVNLSDFVIGWSSSGNFVDWGE